MPKNKKHAVGGGEPPEERAETDLPSAVGPLPDDLPSAGEPAAENDLPADDLPPAEVSPEAAQESADGRTEEPPEEKKKNPVVRFLSSWGHALILIAAVAIVVVLLGLAIWLGGTVYDKIAVIWTFAFACEFLFYIYRGKSPKTLAMLIVTLTLAVVSVVLYGLELAEILP